MIVEINVPPGVEEIYAPLNYNGVILPRYAVSNYGRIWDIVRDRQVSYYHMRGEYWHFRLVLDDGQEKQHSVHRAVLMSFYPIPHFREMQVNHKDGNPQNNELTNLEWVTPVYNTRHAISNGLSKITGLDNGHSKYDPDVIYKICELLDLGLGPAQIANEFGIFDKQERDRFCASVSSIKNGKTHRDISSQFTFAKNLKHREYNLEFAHLVCGVLEEMDGNITCKELMEFLNIPNEYREDFLFYLHKLLYGKASKNVAELYDMKKPSDYDEIAHIRRYNPQRLSKAIYSE